MALGSFNSLGNFKEAVRYYDQDLALAKDLQDKVNMGRAYCNLGLSHLALGNMETALECQRYFLTIAHVTKHTTGKFRALGNIGDLMLKMGQPDEAANVYQKQLQLSKQMRDKALEGQLRGSGARPSTPGLSGQGAWMLHAGIDAQAGSRGRAR